MPKCLHNIKISCQKIETKETRYCCKLGKKYKSLPKFLPSLWVTPQVHGFAKQKSNYSLFYRKICESDTVKHGNNKKQQRKLLNVYFFYFFSISQRMWNTISLFSWLCFMGQRDKSSFCKWSGHWPLAFMWKANKYWYRISKEKRLQIWKYATLHLVLNLDVAHMCHLNNTCIKCYCYIENDSHGII